MTLFHVHACISTILDCFTRPLGLGHQGTESFSCANCSSRSQAFNAHVYDPENLKPGDVVNVGRHHKIRGPCINFFTRQVTGPTDSSPPE
jgi:hypothetical protein